MWRGKQRDGERGRTLEESLSEAAFCFFFLDANHVFPYIGKVVIMRTRVCAAKGTKLMPELTRATHCQRHSLPRPTPK